MTDRIVVGLSGYARSGKDEVAKILIEEFGFKRYAFADKLRDCIYALNPVVVPQEGNYTAKPMRLQEVIEHWGWDGYKASTYGDEIRALLQRMGTEVGRDLIAEDVWVRGLDDQEGRVVITDVRFPNEFDRVKANDGYMWRVKRPGVTAVNAHPSETAIDDKIFDDFIHNDGTLDDLRVLVRRWAKAQNF